MKNDFGMDHLAHMKRTIVSKKNIEVEGPILERDASEVHQKYWRGGSRDDSKEIFLGE